MTTFHVTELRIGQAVPFGPDGALSAIDKHRIDGPVRAEKLGFDGDQQGDAKRHGGPDKAIHAYAVSHMPDWAAELPHRAARFSPGAFGENLVVDGITEADLCLGDLWRVGGALLGAGGVELRVGLVGADQGLVQSFRISRNGGCGEAQGAAEGANCGAREPAPSAPANPP